MTLSLLLSAVNFAISGFISPTMADSAVDVWLGFTLGTIAVVARFEGARPPARAFPFPEQENSAGLKDA
jgi:hypothetical protein